MSKAALKPKNTKKLKDWTVYVEHPYKSVIKPNDKIFYCIHHIKSTDSTKAKEKALYDHAIYVVPININESKQSVTKRYMGQLCPLDNTIKITKKNPNTTAVTVTTNPTTTKRKRKQPTTTTTKPNKKIKRSPSTPTVSQKTTVKNYSKLRDMLINFNDDMI